MLSRLKLSCKYFYSNIKSRKLNLPVNSSEQGVYFLIIIFYRP